YPGELALRRRFPASEFRRVDALRDRGGAAPAVLPGPMDTHPAAVIELAVPGAAALEFFLGVGVVQFAVVPPIAGEVLFQPVAELLAERFVFCAESEVHNRCLSCRTKIEDRRGVSRLIRFAPPNEAERP